MHGVQIGHGSNGVANLEWRLPLDSGYSRRTGSTPKQVHLVKRNTNRIIATSATCVALFVRTNLRFYVLLGDLSASIFRSCSRAFARLCSVLDLGLTTLQQARKNTASLSLSLVTVALGLIALFPQSTDPQAPPIFDIQPTRINPRQWYTLSVR